MLAVCYHRPSRQSSFFATDLRLSEFAARCLLFTAHILLMIACYSLLHFCFSLLATGCLLLAVPFLFLAALLSFLVTRPLAAHCVLPTAPCSLLLSRYSRPSFRFSLLTSCRPLIASRNRGLFIPARGVLFASHHVILLLTDARRSLQSANYSHHSTLIASYTLFLVVRRSLIEICCFLLADRFTHLTRISRSIGVGLNLLEHNLGQIFQKEFPISASYLNNSLLIGALCSISLLAT